MSLFQTITYDDGWKSVLLAAQRVLRRKTAAGLCDPWSIAEIGLDTEDFEWLLQWSQSLMVADLRKLETARKNVEIGDARIAPRPALGLLLTVLFSEVGRRRSKGGALWSVINSTSDGSRVFRDDVVRHMFSISNCGQPTPKLKGLLQEAAYAYGLRHVYGVEGLQNWFDSIHLQFGFTDNGLKRRLPEWLCGYGQPQGVYRLLSGRLKSDSFNDLWSKLKLYRRNLINEDNTRRCLIASPWVLPEWVSDILTSARQRLDIAERDDVDDDSNLFVTEGRLIWGHGQTPHFVCEISGVELLDLSDPGYSVVVRGTEVARLLRQENGEYKLDGKREIIVPVTCSRMNVNLVSGGQVRETNVVAFRDHSEDVTVFQLPKGTPIDCWTQGMDTSKSYAVILASDTTTNLSDSVLRHPIGNDFIIYRLEPGWPEDIQVELDGAVLWRPYLHDRTTRPPQAHTCLARERIVYDQLKYFRKSEFRVIELTSDMRVMATSDGASVEHIVVNRKPIESSDWSEDPKLRISDPVRLKLSSPEIRVRVVLRDKDAHIPVSEQLRLSETPLVGLVRISEDDWETPSPENVFRTSSSWTDLFRAVAPYGNHRSWALLEGDVFLRRLWRSERPLGDVAGLGAPLVLRRGPYNEIQDVPVFSAVLDDGIVCHGALEDGRILVTLKSEIEPDTDFSIVAWIRCAGSLVVKILAVADHHGHVWRSEVISDSDPELLAVGLDYRGNRQGAWWHDGWSSSLNSTTRETARDTAMIIRWLRLPILQSPHCDRLRAFANRFPRTLLTCWLKETADDQPLQLPVVDEAWCAAVRSTFDGWVPTETQAGSLLTGVEGRFKREFLVSLMEVDPVLGCRILKAGMLPSEITETFLFHFAQVAGRCDLDARYADLLEKAARDMLLGEDGLEDEGVSHEFIKRLLDTGTLALVGQDLERADRRNMSLAVINVAPFRDLLGIHLLRSIDT